MTPKVDATKKTDKKKSVVIIPSRLINVTPENNDGIEETEIAAQVTLPLDGGWGWVVVIASFYNVFVVDGTFFTFGSIFPDMREDLKVESTLVALINSTAASLIFLLGPLASALINRFGFRTVAMIGSITTSLTFICTYFATDYVMILIFYGVISGVGGCLISVPSSIITGFYFERLRVVALTIAGAGSSVGIMVMYKLNTMLVELAGWRLTTLVHSGLLSTIYFTSMTFRPLLSITVTATTEEPPRTITYLPSLSRVQVDSGRGQQSGTKIPIRATPTERLFNAVSNYNFPTAASVLGEGIVAQTATVPAGTSAPNVSKLTLIPINPQDSISPKQLKQVQSLKSRPSFVSTGKDKKGIEVTVQLKQASEQAVKKRWWSRLCRWQEDVPESRPMYRDDTFYGGKIQNLPIYQKSVLEVPPEARTGLEYQLAVSRAVTAADLEDTKGICTTAARRILASMMDPKLLKKSSFLLICLNGFLMYLGLLVPYVFVAERNKSEGIDPYHCSLFVSAIGFSNLLGRLISCLLALKIDVVVLYQLSCLFSGIATISYNFSFYLYYQYTCCVGFGLSVASISGLRSMVLVSLFGLDKLTNAIGMMLLCQGVGCLLCTPLSNIFIETLGYSVAFYFAGITMIISFIFTIPVRRLAKLENAKEAQTEGVEN